MIKQAGVLQVENLTSIGCTKKSKTTTTKPVVVSCTGCIRPHLAQHSQPYPNAFLPIGANRNQHIVGKMCFWVCKKQHWLCKYALEYLCKSDEGSALSIMCEICYMKSCLILQTISVPMYMWLRNTLWQEQLSNTFRTSK